MHTFLKMFACLFPSISEIRHCPASLIRQSFQHKSKHPSPGMPGGVFTGSVSQVQKQQSPHEEGFVVCKESDDDLLWLRHHINETDVSLHRNEPNRASLSLRSSKSLSNPQSKRPRLLGGVFHFIRSLTMTYFHMRNAHYHWREVVSLSCSRWEGVGPTCYGRQT